MIAALDRLLLDRVYVPLSQWAGARFGSTAGSLARGCIAPMVVFHLVRVGAEWPDCSLSWALVATGFNLGLAAWFYATAAWADSVPNRLALEPPPFRVVWVLAAVLILAPFSPRGAGASLALAAHQLALVSHLYFRACPPPPPKRLRRERLALGAA